jgi:hypothetical protein
VKRQTDPFQRVDRALSVFSQTVNELRDAAAAHSDIATAAHEQIIALTEAKARNQSAAYDAIRKADKIAELLS